MKLKNMKEIRVRAGTLRALQKEGACTRGQVGVICVTGERKGRITCGTININYSQCKSESILLLAAAAKRGKGARKRP
jgi:hypothetical protein